MSRPVCVLLIAAVLGACAAPRERATGPSLADGARADIALLETTDLHANVVGYDYFKASPDTSIGLDRVATLIHAARAEFPNSFLFDAGDTIQGTALSDYQAQVAPLPCEQKLATYKAMDALGYDAGTIGNHEFNYGLPFLAQVTGHPLAVDGVTPRVCRGPSFPFVLSNAFSTRDGEPLYAPTLVVEKTITAYTPDGSALKVPLRIGLLGFTPPPILQWDKRHLDGKVSVLGVVEAAKRYLPLLREQHVDLVVAISHGGLNADRYTESMENANWHLAGVAGIDAILLGHSHDVFPNTVNPKSRFNDMPDVDNAKGLVRGVPAVMGGFWGKDLGVIKLALARVGGRWQVQRDQSYAQVRPICPTPGECVAPDPQIAQLIRKEHAATIKYVNTPIGRSTVRLNTYFAEVGGVSALAVVNAAQRDYTRAWLREQRPDLAAVPVLSAASAFKAGFAGPDDYTDVPAGPLTVRNAADLYLYPNTIYAVKVDGTELKAWLENSARRFARIDPAATTAQSLVDPKVPTYVFDVIQGDLSYVIDVTRPVGERIVELRHAGRPVTPEQGFVVATNNYRASGLPGITDDAIVMKSATTNRDVVIDWIKAHPKLTAAEFEPSPWRFAAVASKTKPQFRSRAGVLAVAAEEGVRGVSLVEDNGDGSATYAIDLAR